MFRSTSAARWNAGICLFYLLCLERSHLGDAWDGRWERPSPVCLDRGRPLRTTPRSRFYPRASAVTECRKNEYNRVESKSFFSLKLTPPARVSEGAFGGPPSNETEPRCVSIFRLHMEEEGGRGEGGAPAKRCSRLVLPFSLRLLLGEDGGGQRGTPSPPRGGWRGSGDAATQTALGRNCCTS